MIALVRLARPHFLLGGGLLFALGALAADHVGAADYLLGQAMVSAIQVTAHLVNEYADANADAAVEHRTWFSGGSGVIASGAATRSTALRMAMGTTLIASVAIGMIAVQAPAGAAIGVVALAVAWAYSIEPLRLLGSGLGEVVTTVVVAAGVPLVGALSNGGPVTAELWWAIGFLAPIHFGMMLIFELPDLASDRAAGKRVLAVRLGARRARRLAATVHVTAFLVLGVALAAGARGGSAWAGVAAVPAILSFRAVAREQWGLATTAAVGALVLGAVGFMPGL